MVIGLAAYVLSQPEKGTVEWHRRAYLTWLEQPDEGDSMLKRFSGAAEDLTGFRFTGDPPEQTVDDHLRFLLATGVLVSTVFPIRDEEWLKVATKALTEAKLRIPPERGRYWYLTGNETSLWVVSLPEDAPVWVELINKRAK